MFVVLFVEVFLFFMHLTYTVIIITKLSVYDNRVIKML